jgi:hypothetical protein
MSLFLPFRRSVYRNRGVAGGGGGGGQVIDALHVSGGRIDIAHNNVTIKRCLFTSPGGEAVWNLSGSGLLIEDCEFDGTGNPTAASAIAFGGIVRRCHIHSYGEGFAAFSDNSTLEDSYLHNFTDYVASGAHQDGIQMEYGSNMTVRHNTILHNVNGANSCIWVSHQPHSGIIIENNLCAGGGYTIGAGGGGPNNNTDIRVRYNRISTQFYPNGGSFGPFAYTTGIIEFTGNVWHETGEPI